MSRTWAGFHVVQGGHACIVFLLQPLTPALTNGGQADSSNGLEQRVSRTLDGRQRQKQGKRRVWQGNEAVMPVESRCRLVLGVHHQGEGGNLRTGGTVKRIGQQRTA
jgi:hypothetical protein